MPAIVLFIQYVEGWFKGGGFTSEKTRKQTFLNQISKYKL